MVILDGYLKTRTGNPRAFRGQHPEHPSGTSPGVWRQGNVRDPCSRGSPANRRERPGSRYISLTERTIAVRYSPRPGFLSFCMIPTHQVKVHEREGVFL